MKITKAKTNKFRCNICSKRIKKDTDMVFQQWVGLAYHPSCYKKSGKELPVSTITPEESGNG